MGRRFFFIAALPLLNVISANYVILFDLCLEEGTRFKQSINDAITYSCSDYCSEDSVVVPGCEFCCDRLRKLYVEKNSAIKSQEETIRNQTNIILKNEDEIIKLNLIVKEEQFNNRKSIVIIILLTFCLFGTIIGFAIYCCIRAKRQHPRRSSKIFPVDIEALSMISTTELKRPALENVETQVEAFKTEHRATQTGTAYTNTNTGGSKTLFNRSVSTSDAITEEPIFKFTTEEASFDDETSFSKLVTIDKKIELISAS